MGIDWVRVFNGLFRLLDESGTPTYYSGGRFISKVREVDPLFPDYTQYMDERRRTNKNSSGKGGDRQRAVDIRESDRVNQAALEDLISAQPLRYA